MKIAARFDVRAATLDLQALADSAVPEAVARALNRTATSVRAQAIRQIRKSLPVTARAMRGRLRIWRASRLRRNAVIAATRDYDPPLFLFNPKWKPRQPVGATIRQPGGGRQAVAGAFLASTPYGRPAVFRRVGRARKPLKFLRASDIGLPTVAAAFLQAAADATLLTRARERFAREIANEMRRVRNG